MRINGSLCNSSHQCVYRPHLNRDVSSVNTNTLQSCGASPPILDHIGSPATRHRRTRPHLSPCSQAGWNSIYLYPVGTVMLGWTDGSFGYVLRWFTCQLTVTHPSSNRPGVEKLYSVYMSNALPLRQAAILPFHPESITVL